MNKDNVNINSDFWVGIVEDNSNDPMKIGQCRIRIIGTHSFDGTELPTEALPWAIPTIPLNGSKTISVPNIGDWVFGYFLDGKNKQMPVILGIMPGLTNKTSYVKLTGQQQREYLQKIAVEPLPVKTMNTNDGVVSGETATQQGEPTTPRISRGDVANTAIAITNQNVGHTCHVASEMSRLMNLAKLETSKVVLTVRESISTALASGGSVFPALQGLQSVAKYIADKIVFINSILDQIIEPIQKVITAVAEIRAIIEYILSLPAKIVAYLQKCLDELYAALYKGAFGILGTITSGADGLETSELSALATSVSTIVTESQTALEKVATIAASPAAIASALLQPSNLSDSEKANLTSQIFPGVVTFENNLYRTI